MILSYFNELNSSIIVPFTVYFTAVRTRTTVGLGTKKHTKYTHTQRERLISRECVFERVERNIEPLRGMEEQSGEEVRGRSKQIKVRVTVSSRLSPRSSTRQSVHTRRALGRARADSAELLSRPLAIRSLRHTSCTG